MRRNSLLESNSNLKHVSRRIFSISLIVTTWIYRTQAVKFTSVVKLFAWLRGSKSRFLDRFDYGTVKRLNVNFSRVANKTFSFIYLFFYDSEKSNQLPRPSSSEYSVFTLNRLSLMKNLSILHIYFDIMILNI